MNVCCRCYEVKEKGRREGLNFTCDGCLAIERTAASQMNRREKLADGRVKYPCGHVMVVPEEE